LGATPNSTDIILSNAIVDTTIGSFSNTTGPISVPVVAGERLLFLVALVSNTPGTSVISGIVNASLNIV
jgi:hypothetical protein